MFRRGREGVGELSTSKLDGHPHLLSGKNIKLLRRHKGLSEDGKDSMILWGCLPFKEGSKTVQGLQQGGKGNSTTSTEKGGIEGGRREFMMGRGFLSGREQS